MAKLLSEVLKVDQAIVGGAVAPGAIAVSRLIPMDMHRKALVAFGLTSANMDGGDVIDIGIVDDTVVTPAATAALAALNVAGNTVAFEQITASIRVSSMSIELAAAGDGAVTINGTVFPYDAAPVLGSGEWDTAAALVIEIGTSGLGITAIAAGTVVTLTPTIPGSVDISVVSTVTAVIDADMLTLEAIAYLEVDASQFAPGATGFYVVLDNVVANTGTVAIGAILLRGEPRNAPVTQNVAAHS